MTKDNSWAYYFMYVVKIMALGIQVDDIKKNSLAQCVDGLKGTVCSALNSLAVFLGPLQNEVKLMCSL